MPGTPLEHFLRIAAKKAYAKVIDADEAMFAKSVEELGIRISQVEESTEALPIATADDKIMVHFSSPQVEVVSKAAGLGTFNLDDDESDGTEAVISLSSADLKMINVSRVSVVFDVARVDELSGATFAKEMQFMLREPEMLLL